MSRYCVRITGPTGCEGYLHWGRTGSREAASYYAHPANAQRAAEAYRTKRPGVRAEVEDTRITKGAVPVLKATRSSALATGETGKDRPAAQTSRRAA